MGRGGITSAALADVADATQHIGWETGWGCDNIRCIANSADQLWKVFTRLCKSKKNGGSKKTWALPMI